MGSDIIVTASDHTGRFVTFEPLTDEAREYLKEHTEGWELLGDVLRVDGRFAEAIIDDLFNAGFALDGVRL